MSIEYRMKSFGGSHYMMPKVGKAFTKEQTDYIKQTLRDVGYFVSLITPGKIAVAETSQSKGVDYIEIYF